MEGEQERPSEQSSDVVGDDDVATIAAKIAEREKQREERKKRSVLFRSVSYRLTFVPAEARLAMLKKEEEEEQAKQEERRKRQCVSDF